MKSRSSRSSRVLGGGPVHRRPASRRWRARAASAPSSRSGRTRYAAPRGAAPARRPAGTRRENCRRRGSGRWWRCGSGWPSSASISTACRAAPAERVGVDDAVGQRGPVLLGEQRERHGPAGSAAAGAGRPVEVARPAAATVRCSKTSRDRRRRSRRLAQGADERRRRGSSRRRGRRSCRATPTRSTPEQLGPDRGEPLLDRGRAARRTAGPWRSACAGRARAAPRRSSLPLAVSGSRASGDERGGHHVLRQGARRSAARAGRAGARPLVAGTDVRRPAGVSPGCPRGRRRRPRAPRAGGERGLDLAQLDPVAPDLHLVVDPAEELQAAVGAPAGQVAACGRARAPGGAERVGHEPLARSARAGRGSPRATPAPPT